MSPTHTIALKITTVLWVIWGLVHMLAGIIILSSDASGGFAAVADNVDPALLVHDYHGAVGGILHQHGWNLAWIGAGTVVGGIFIWRGNLTAIWVSALLGGMADLGYLFFMDFPGYVHFMPGTLMTFISGAAVIISFWVWFSVRGKA